MAKEKSFDEKVVESGRNPAPDMDVDNPFFDERAHIIQSLNKENPDFEYMYQNPEVKPWELKVKNQEIVKDETGEPLHHMGDPVVRVPKGVWDKRNARLHAMSALTIKEITRKGNLDTDELHRKASPKKPKSDQEVDKL
jgi:hypothetical protein